MKTPSEALRDIALGWPPLPPRDDQIPKADTGGRHVHVVAKMSTLPGVSVSDFEWMLRMADDGVGHDIRPTGPSFPDPSVYRPGDTMLYMEWRLGRDGGWDAGYTGRHVWAVARVVDYRNYGAMLDLQFWDPMTEAIPS